MSDNTQLPAGSGGDLIRTIAKTGNAGAKTQALALDVGGGSDSSPEIILTAGPQVKASSISTTPATDLANIEPSGAAITGASMPAGGVGLTGWLSAIWKALTGTLTVSWSGQSVTIATVSLPSTSTSSAASSIVLKSAPGSLVTLDVVAGAVAGYIMLFDATAAPADGAVSPKWVFAMAAGGALTEDWTNPLSFATGIVAVFSSTGPFIKTASATAFMAGQVQ